MFYYLVILFISVINYNCMQSRLEEGQEVGRRARGGSVGNLILQSRKSKFYS